MKFVKSMLLAALVIALAATGSSMQAKAGKFDAAFYAAAYPDVFKVYGTDQKALYEHYVTLGQREGRVPFSGATNGEIVEEMLASNTSAVNAKGKFNPVFYATKYPDVSNVYGTDAQKLYNHYLTSGQKESRIPYPDATGGEAVTGIANAEEMAKQTAPKPVTYIIKYVTDKNDWRFLRDTNTWSDTGAHRDLYYLKEAIKDGDIIVIETDANLNAPYLNLNLPVKLGNVTFKGNGMFGITAKSIEDVYVLKNSTGIILGDVTNAYLTDNAVAQFGNEQIETDVANLYLLRERTSEQTVNVAGTVDLVQIKDVGEKVYKQYFAFRKGTFSMQNGILKTNEAYYSIYRP